MDPVSDRITIPARVIRVPYDVVEYVSWTTVLWVVGYSVVWRKNPLIILSILLWLHGYLLYIISELCLNIGYEAQHINFWIVSDVNYISDAINSDDGRSAIIDQWSYKMQFQEKMQIKTICYKIYTLLRELCWWWWHLFIRWVLTVE